MMLQPTTAEDISAVLKACVSFSQLTNELCGQGALRATLSWSSPSVLKTQASNLLLTTPQTEEERPFLLATSLPTLWSGSPAYRVSGPVSSNSDPEDWRCQSEGRTC